MIFLSYPSMLYPTDTSGVAIRGALRREENSMQGPSTPFLTEEHSFSEHNTVGTLPVTAADQPGDGGALPTSPLPSSDAQQPMWTPGYGLETPVPPYGGNFPPTYPPIYPSQPPRRRSPIRLVLALLIVLLVGLAGGVALGHAGSGSASSNNTVIGAQSAP